MTKAEKGLDRQEIQRAVKNTWSLNEQQFSTVTLQSFKPSLIELGWNSIEPSLRGMNVYDGKTADFDGTSISVPVPFHL